MKKLLMLGAIFSAGALLSGCGGGSGGGSTVTVEILGNGIYYVAFQDGSGQWQDVTPSGTFISPTKTRYTLSVTNPSGSYGVMVFCETDNKGYILQAETSEINSISYPCGSPPFTISGNVNKTDPNNSVSVFWRRTWFNLGTSVTSYSISAYPETRSLIAIEYDPSNNSVKVFKQTLTINGNRTQNIDFNSASTADLTTATFTCTDPDFFGVYLSFWDGTQAYLGEGDGPTVNLKKVIPDSLAGRGGWLYAYDFDGDVGIEAVYTTFNNRTCKKPNQYTGTATKNFVSGNLTLNWDAWNPGIVGHTLKNYNFYVWDGINDPRWNITLTNGWLNSCTNCSYTFPDLTTIGWNSGWAPTSSYRVRLFAEASNGTWSDYVDCYLNGVCVNGIELSWVRANVP
ncbi:MAG: hypothetical protein GXO18_02730 [Aquificae bacterium]|nr:hypothetical protein [Aquificota bacterium]